VTTSKPSYYMDEDYPEDLKSNNLSQNKATDVAQNRPLWKLMCKYDAKHSQWCMPEKNKKTPDRLYSVCFP